VWLWRGPRRRSERRRAFEEGFSGDKVFSDCTGWTSSFCAERFPETHHVLPQLEVLGEVHAVLDTVVSEALEGQQRRDDAGLTLTIIFAMGFPGQAYPAMSSVMMFKKLRRISRRPVHLLMRFHVIL
jgi:hypothetical protein